MGDYISLSLETHLFFARIMKEHALFLEAGFPCADVAWMERADWFKLQFEDLLRDTVRISNGRVHREVLQSEELVTEYTIPAERSTEQLSGVSIDSSITTRQHNLRAGHGSSRDCNSNCCNNNNCGSRNGNDNYNYSREMGQDVDRINHRALELLEDLIVFKECILEEVGKGRLFNANYPLLIEHIIREAKLYRDTVKELLENGQVSSKCLREIEEFWNRIMMEHALFIRGLLDPSEEELMETADQFAAEYKELLEKARQQDCKAMGLTEKALEETMRYRDFKATGTAGILDCKISSIIMPLLADHVLREANHYIRLLELESK